MEKLKGKRIVITGGTGSLGTSLVKRLLSEGDKPDRITIFSRDENKQYEMKQAYPSKLLKFVIGDVRDYWAVREVISDAEIVFHTAALKHVPSCEDNPREAVLTNIMGVDNIIRAIKENKARVDTVIGVSTDKGCQPVNVYGMTKFIQERLLVDANKRCPSTRFISVLYGNVMGSRGSMLPLFQKQIREGGPVTITDPSMTRFLITLDLAVDTLFAALCDADPGDIYIPRGIPAATVGDIADVLIGESGIKKKIIGIRPGEKVHEVLISLSESNRVVEGDDFYVLTPQIQKEPAITKDYVSSDHVISKDILGQWFRQLGIIQ